MTAAAPGLLVANLSQMLQDLDAVCSDWRGDELQMVAKEAEGVLTKLRGVLKRTQLQKVANLVQKSEWDKASEQMQLSYPGGTMNIGLIEEVLALAYVRECPGHLTSIIEWVGQLDVRFHLKAYQLLFEQIEAKEHTNEPEMLLLKSKLEVLHDEEGDLGDVRIKLEGLCRKIMKKIVQEVKNNDDFYDICEFNNMHESIDGVLVLKYIMSTVVHNLDVRNPDNVLLLVNYSIELSNSECSWFLLDAILTALEASKLLGSLQGMHVWACINYYYGRHFNWDYESEDIKKLCTYAQDKLNKHKVTYFLLYQKYVEGREGFQIDSLHQNCYLRSMVCEFVSWYICKPPDDVLDSVDTLLSAARSIPDMVAIQLILSQLHDEAPKFKQASITSVFNELKHYMLSQRFHSLDQEEKRQFEQLKAKAPNCLRLILWPDEDERQLRLVNKFYDSPLCIQDKKVFCCSSQVDNDQEQLCSVSVEADTALTTFSFECGDTRCKLDVSDLENIVPWTGTQWNVQAVDKHHVKIFADYDHGIFFIYLY
jgi:hypothetical protein